MATVVLFHSVYGLRPFERDAAARLGAAGHRVITPDLFDGRIAATVDEGFGLEESVGWDVICRRAAEALSGVSEDAVLAGVSMGAHVVGAVWDARPRATGVLLLHGLADLPDTPRPGLPVQLHLAEPDPYEAEEEVAAWATGAADAGMAAEVFRYPGAGHIFTDPALPDHRADDAERAWDRIAAFLARV